MRSLTAKFNTATWFTFDNGQLSSAITVRTALQRLTVRFPPYSVEEVALMLAIDFAGTQANEFRARSGGCKPPDRDHLRHLAEVLGCGGQVELVFRSVWTPQAQAIQLQDALEVGEQHLDLFPLAA